MASRRKIIIGDLVNDIRSGMTDAELMAKYRVSARGLHKIFKQLLATRVITAYEIFGRDESCDDSVRLEDLRESSRRVVNFHLPVHDTRSPQNRGIVRDISRKGLRIEGLESHVGEVRSLAIPNDNLYISEPIQFQAVCRWIQAKGASENPVAGFEITKLSSGDLHRLIHLIDSLPFEDEKIGFFSDIDSEEDFTESVDLGSVFTNSFTGTGSFRLPGIGETWFGQLLQALPIYSIVAEESLRVTFANRCVRELGIDYGNLVGERLTYLFPDDTFAHQVVVVAKQVLETRKQAKIEGGIEIDGVCLWGRIHFKPLRFGSKRALLVLIEDLTAERELIVQKEQHNEKLLAEIRERQLAEEEREDLRNQLVESQKMEAVGTLAGGIAHDFNNLLQVILGYTELLISKKGSTHEDYADLQTIFKAGCRGADLVQSILTFSRRAETNLRPINLNNEVRRAHQLLIRTIPKMIDIELRLADHLKAVNADPTQMEQILLNLAVNSRDAMPNGGRFIIETENVFLDEEYCRRRLEVRPGYYVRLTVSDTGCGMAPTVLERIFDPFFTTKQVGEGTGLGLSTVFGIVKAHGGHIVCYSEPAVGTTFKIDIPVIQTGTDSAVEPHQVAPAFGTETILIADDEKDLRELAKRHLTKAGYKILTAENGLQALEVYRENQSEIALVILDLIMPEMGGKDCLEKLLEINPKIKVVVASGLSAYGPTRATIEAGAKGFVGKPFRVREMLRTIREILDGD